MANNTLVILVHCVDSELGFDRFFFSPRLDQCCGIQRPHKKNSVLGFITAREHTLNGINVDPVA